MENSNMEMLDVKALFRYFLRNWYWFIIALVFFGAAAAYFYATRQHSYEVRMIVQLSTEEESVLLPGTDLLRTTNKAVNIGDEQAVLVSYEVAQTAVKEARLNVAYYEKQHLRWMEKTAAWGDVVATWPNEAVSCLRQPLQMTVSVGKNAVEVATKCGRERTTHKLNSLAEPWTSPEGITLSARKELKAGNQYRLVFMPTDAILSRYDFKADYPRKSNTMLELTAETARPHQTMAIMANQVKVYNCITQAKRQKLAEQTIARIDERLAELTQQKANAQSKEAKDQLILLLMQRRVEKVMALENNTPPAVIVSAPHITSKTISPSLGALSFIAFLLGIGLPLAVLYIIFVFRSQE